MKHKDKKFAYKYAPMDKWVYIFYEAEKYHVHLVDEFLPECCFSSKNIAQEVLEMSEWYKTEAHSMGNVDTDLFELITIEIIHRTPKKPK